MAQRRARGSTYGPSTMSGNTEMSQAVDGLQKMRIGSSSRKPTPVSTVDEDGFTTVQNNKSGNVSARISSMKIGSRNAPSTMAPIAENNNLSPPKGQGHRIGSPSAAAKSRLSAYTSSDWRGGSQPAFSRPDQPGVRVHGNVRSSNHHGVYRSNFFHPGMIIGAPLHEQDYNAANSTMTTDNKSITASEMFGSIHSKHRKMIVVACFSKHYVAVPLYTHNGRGLANKRADEYVSVRDHRDLSTPFQPLSRHGSLLTEHLNSGIAKYKVLTTAHITYPVSRSYDCEIVHEGNLEGRSTNHLIELFNRFAPKTIPITQ